MTTISNRVGMSVALCITLLGGWLWGASGTGGLERALQAAELRNDLIAARASLLAARVALYHADFRQVSRYLADARGLADRAGARLESLGWREEEQRLDLAAFAAEIDAAERLAARLARGLRGARVRGPDATTVEEVVGRLAAP